MERPVAAVVALKPVTSAKSRLATLPDPLRRRLAWTMAVDTLRALATAGAALLVVGDEPGLASRLARAGVLARVVGETGAAGMNAALGRGAELLAADGHRDVLAVVGDLPALRAETVRRLLQVAPAAGRGYLADAAGTGTTMLLARGAPLDPRFQGLSAAAHATSGAAPLAPLLDDGADARRDVDTEDDLAIAVDLGLGRATTALVDPVSRRLGRYTVITTTDHRDDHGRSLAVSAAGHRLVLDQHALADGLRSLRPGQRLHAVHAGRQVLSAWL